jgi:hypothetical protein
MNYLVRGQTVDAGTPLLDAWFPRDGFLVDLNALQFQIWSTGSSPTQQFPAVAGTWQAVNVAATYPTAGAGRVGKGHYAATWTAAGDQTVGLYEVRWQWKIAAGDPFRQFSTVFEVLLPGEVSGQRGYCAVKDLRDDGLPPESLSNASALADILIASRQIEDITGRWFEPRYLPLTVDGSGRAAQALLDPIVGIESAKLTYDGDFTNAVAIDSVAYRVYARHLDGVINPDDRDFPRLEFVSIPQMLVLLGPSARWFYGQRNVEIRGAFGFTDWDGSPAGRTPDLIRYACRLMAKRLASTTPGGLAPGGPLVRQRTRDQEVQYATPLAFGTITGDRDLDGILERFRRPMRAYGV